MKLMEKAHTSGERQTDNFLLQNNHKLCHVLNFDSILFYIYDDQASLPHYAACSII